MTEVNGPDPEGAEPQIAMFCGRQLLHINLQTGQWEPDPQGRQGCFKEPGEILSYCQEMYPALPISHIEESKRPVTIPAWCKKGWGHCQPHPFIVLPYRCLGGEYVSEALLVPDRCRFLHQEQMDACESYVYWHNIAKEECTADNLELHSYGMLLPCGDHFRGVEYVCCPGRGSSNGKAEMEERDVPAAPQTFTSQTSGKLNSVTKKSQKPTTSAPLMKEESLTTPRPTDGVDVYFEKPVDDTEHANFLRAKTDLEERRMKRINEIMKEWAEADNQSKNLPRLERQALNEHFQSVLQTLEEQVAGERQRLVETHLVRVEAILNNNRRLALENYLNAVQSDPPQPERVLQALKRYMAAEQKDRRHTLRHYQHIVAVDPQKAEQMKFQVYTHLHVIEERMNQSLALLYKDPNLAEELHDDIQELVKAERGDISELMTTSFSETRTTEELLPNRPYPPRIEVQPNKKALVSPVEEYDYTTSERGPTYEYEEKINTSVELKQVVNKPPEIERDELQPDALETFNRGAMVGLLVVAVAIAMVMVISLLLVRRKPYGTISHGIVEVDPMLTPEERQLNKMQNHGYENPTYKFFEQMN
ncbi:Amyloid-like protein 1 [Dissostichus eleginoides]|uniref:Amyloid-like protein 1 n=1 Tax=Dissostichus eleginoides TaxID=100907 RepID=A0AAD9FBX8_DISEL|nr:Amyloid-like protein 1 [Dissostichus eleginoides]